MKRVRIFFNMSKPGKTAEDSFTAKTSDRVADKLLGGEATSKTEAFITSLAGLRDYREAAFIRAEPAEEAGKQASAT